jgi:hypothetical protein
VPTEEKLFLSFNMYFLVFYNIHNHELLELNMVTIVVWIVVESVPYSLSLILFLLILRLLSCTSISQTINSLLIN